MKNLRITVNGTAYDVQVEELGEGAYNFRFILAEGEEYAEIFLDVPIMGVEDE